MAHHNGDLYGDILYGKSSGAPAWNDIPIQYNRDTDGWDIELPIKGTLTNTQPITDQPKNHHNGHVLPGFEDDFYNRILIEPSIINVGNLVSDQARIIKVFNGYFTARTLEDLLIQDGEGLSISGPVTPSVWAQLQTKTYLLSLSSDGPATIDAQLLFDWDGTADDSIVGVTGVRIVSLPYQAQAPLSEILEWKTNVLISNDGTEQRIRSRKSPRQSFSATFPVSNEEMARAQNLVYGWLARKWAIPVWAEVQSIGVVTAGDIVLSADTEHSDLREGSLCMLWASPTSNEIVEIESLLPNSITLARGVINTYLNAILLPVRTGRIAGQATRKTNGHVATLGISFQVQDNIELLASTPAQYLGEDIYYSEQLLGDNGSLDDGIIRRVDVVDYATGVVDFYSPWKDTQVSRTFNFLSEGPEECWDFRLFLHRRAGRLRPFWLPTFEADMRLDMVGLVTSSLTIFSDNYRGLADTREHIVILLQDNTWHPRHVTGTALVDGDHINVAIDSPLLVDASQIKMICYLGLKRFDTDRIELNWPGAGVCMAAIRMLEISP